MSSITVHVRASRAEVLRVLRAAPKVIAGKQGIQTKTKEMLTRIGQAVLKKVHEEFAVKALGGTDECGLRWKPLSPVTIALRKRNRGKPIVRKRQPAASRRTEQRPSFMLTPTQRRRWWSFYRRFLGRYGGDKARAAATAWVALKAVAAVRTLLQVYGNAKVLILRDSDLLYESLRPGMLAVAGAASQVVRRRYQVFRIERSGVVVGTNRPHAGKNHRGIPGRLPQRRLWPAPASWTPSFWRPALEQAKIGGVQVILYLLRKF